MMVRREDHWVRLQLECRKDFQVQFQLGRGRSVL